MKGLEYPPGTTNYTLRTTVRQNYHDKDICKTMSAISHWNCLIFSLHRLIFLASNVNILTFRFRWYIDIEVSQLMGNKCSSHKRELSQTKEHCVTMGSVVGEICDTRNSVLIFKSLWAAHKWVCSKKDKVAVAERPVEEFEIVRSSYGD